jgi:hypothetical protein
MSDGSVQQIKTEALRAQIKTELNSLPPEENKVIFSMPRGIF